MVRFPAKTVLLILILLMAVPSIQAAEPREEVNPGRSSPTAQASWGFLVELWGVFTNAWSENGCILDPNGGCSPRQATTDSDNGCGLDPSGGCRD